MQKSKTGDKWDMSESNSHNNVDNVIVGTNNADCADKSEIFIERKWLIGIDEVGRGPLAGPVTVGAVAILIEGSIENTYEKIRKNFIEISGREYPIGVDSKKMKEKDRDFWFDIIQKNENIDAYINNSAINSIPLSFHVSVQHMSAHQIDQKGIAVCIAELVDLNIKKMLEKIQLLNPNATLKDIQVLLDGGLKTNLSVGNQQTIIKGDEKELLISLASVRAKVTRDRHMEELSKNSKYAGYGFEVHKGYGTLKHREFIKTQGLSDEHRRSFCKNITG